MDFSKTYLLPSPKPNAALGTGAEQMQQDNPNPEMPILISKPE